MIRRRGFYQTTETAVFKEVHMSIREECGVFGIFSHKETDVARLTYYGLYALQHRGQESCGIVVNNDGLVQQTEITVNLSKLITIKADLLLRITETCLTQLN